MGFLEIISAVMSGAIGGAIVLYVCIRITFAKGRW